MPEEAVFEQNLVSPGQTDPELVRITEWEIIGRIGMRFRLFAPGPQWLAEANVQRHNPAADMWVSSVEYPVYRSHPG